MGMLEFGISYPGFYATYSLLSRHPALKAVSPQACISDFSLMIFTINLFVELLKATRRFWYSKTERTLLGTKSPS
jgi:predicted acyl esterase